MQPQVALRVSASSQRPRDTRSNVHVLESLFHRITNVPVSVTRTYFPLSFVFTPSLMSHLSPLIVSARLSFVSYLVLLSGRPSSLYVERTLILCTNLTSFFLASHVLHTMFLRSGMLVCTQSRRAYIFSRMVIRQVPSYCQTLAQDDHCVRVLERKLWMSSSKACKIH